jgi:hypothetical protein
MIHEHSRQRFLEAAKSAETRPESPAAIALMTAVMISGLDDPAAREVSLALPDMPRRIDHGL